MKRKLLFLIGLSSAIYATQEISCVDFVNLSKVKAKSYLDNYRKEFELNHFKTKGHTDIDRTYIGMQEDVSKHLLRCINLQKVTRYDVEDVRRALILTSLSKKTLSPKEQSLYQKSLQENIAHYKTYSNSSISNVQYMPLVYLTIDSYKDKGYYVVYEFRKNGAEIKRYSKKILVSQPYLKFSDINAVSNQNYLVYLNSNKTNANLKVYPAKRQVKTFLQQKTNSSHNMLKTSSEEDKYIVIKSFKALYRGAEFKDAIDIYPNYLLIKIKEEGNHVYFLDEQNNEYFVAKTWWKKGTRNVGGQR